MGRGNPGRHDRGQQVAAHFSMQTHCYPIYNTSLLQLASMSENYHPTQKGPLVVHYHYHYYFDAPPPPSLTSHREETLRRVRSDHKQSFRHPYSPHSETESNSSHQSWKRSIKPHLQSTLPSAYRSSHNTSMLKQQERLDETCPNSAFRTTISDFTLKKPYNPERKERSISSLLPKAPDTSPQTTLPSGLSQGRLDQSRWNGPNTEPSLTKSRFCKKRQIQILSANKLKQLTTHHLPSPHKDYRYVLLEEECQYLRQRFMEHVERRHPQETQQ